MALNSLYGMVGNLGNATPSQSPTQTTEKDPMKALEPLMAGLEGAGAEQRNQASQYRQQSRDASQAAYNIEAPNSTAPAFRTADAIGLGLLALVSGRHFDKALMGYMGAKNQKAEADTQAALQAFGMRQKSMLSQAQNLAGMADDADAIAAKKEQLAQQKFATSASFLGRRLDNQDNNARAVWQTIANIKDRKEREENTRKFLADQGKGKDAQWYTRMFMNALTKAEQDMIVQTAAQNNVTLVPPKGPTGAVQAFATSQEGKVLDNEGKKYDNEGKQLGNKIKGAQLTYQEMRNKYYPDQVKKDMEVLDQRILDSKSAIAKRAREGGLKPGKLDPDTKNFLNLQIQKMKVEKLGLEQLIENSNGKSPMGEVFRQSAKRRIQALAMGLQEAEGKLKGVGLVGSGGVLPAPGGQPYPGGFKPTPPVNPPPAPGGGRKPKGGTAPKVDPKRPGLRITNINGSVPGGN